MLTLGELYQQYFPGEPYPDDSMQESDYFIPLWDFLIFLGNHGYVFTDVYFSEGRIDPEPARTRPPARELEKLKNTLTEPRKPGQNNFVITDYADIFGLDDGERTLYWIGKDAGKHRGMLEIKPSVSESELDAPQQTITGFRIWIDWYVHTRHRMDRFKTWVIYLGTQPTDSYAAADLNALLRKYVPLKYIINYCHRMPTLDE
jgi:hypothetical protein